MTKRSASSPHHVMVYRLPAGVVVDGSALALRNPIARVPVEPKPLELLMFLIAQRHRVVTKAELLDTLWSDVHVAEVALSRAVSVARKALRQAGVEGELIRNVRGRGYQFVAEVELDPADAREPALMSIEHVAQRVAELSASVVTLNHQLHVTMGALQALVQLPTRPQG